MAMRATTVRFSDDLWRLLEEEASREGVSAAQYVRDATVMRVGYTMGRRGDAAMETALARIGGAAAPPPAPSTGPGPPVDVLTVVRDRERLGAVRATGLLDAPPQPRFDRLTSLASEVLGTPVALMTLVDADRQVFASCIGLPEPWQTARETPLTHSFCQHAVASREPLVVHDAREHPVLQENLAIRDLDVVAYLGVPLIDSAGHALGSLCAIDSRPRQWTRAQVSLLQSIAASVTTELELDRLRRASDDG
jgi:hypothetical protein